MKKPTLCCCFVWIVFIEINFTVAFLLIRKTWDGRFVGGTLKDFKKWGGIQVIGDDFEIRELIPLYELCTLPNIYGGAF